MPLDRDIALKSPLSYSRSSISRSEDPRSGVFQTDQSGKKISARDRTATVLNQKLHKSVVIELRGRLGTVCPDHGSALPDDFRFDSGQILGLCVMNDRSILF